MISILTGENGFDEKIRAVAQLVTEDPQLENGCLFVKMRAVQPEMGEKKQVLLTHIEQLALEAFENALQQGRNSGEWSGRIPVSQGARHLHAQIGLALDMRARSKRRPIELIDFLRCHRSQISDFCFSLKNSRVR